MEVEMEVEVEVEVLLFASLLEQRHAPRYTLGPHLHVNPPSDLP